MIWFSSTYQPKTDLSTSIQPFHRIAQNPFPPYKKILKKQAELCLVFASITSFDRCITVQ